MGRGQELLDAARNGDKRTVEKILGQITKRSGPFTSLRRGAGVNVQDDNGYTPLHHACLHGHKEIVWLLLAVDASPCIVDKRGATPLHLAAWKGESSIVAMLLAHKNPPVNVDQVTVDQETALISAAHFGYTDVVAQLIEKGADVTIRNIRDESALDLAAQYGRLETVQHLIHVMPHLMEPYKLPRSRGKTFSTTPLHRASKNGLKEVVKVLLAAGMDPNIRTYNGVTPLHEAACYGKASVVRILLANGADLNAVDRHGKSVHSLLSVYPEEATRKVRRVIRDYENRSRITTYESEEDLPPFPVQDYSPTSYPLPNIVCDQTDDAVDSLCPNTDASLSNINFGDYKKYKPVSNADSVRNYKTLSPLSPSLKKDIIEVSKKFRERSFTYSVNTRNKLEVTSIDTSDIYANQFEIESNENINRESKNNADFEVYENLRIPDRKGSDDASPLFGKKKPKPLPKPPVPKKSSIKESIFCTPNTEKTINISNNICINDKEVIKQTNLCESDENHYVAMDKKSVAALDTPLDCTDTNLYVDNVYIDASELKDTVYMNTIMNLPDDEKAKKIAPVCEDTYISMDNNSSSMTTYVEMGRKSNLKKNSAPDAHIEHGVHGDYYYVKSIDARGKTKYLCMDRRKQFQMRRRSIPDNISKKCTSVHIKGDNVCMYEPLDYLYIYDLNPDALSNNAHPFIKRKEKANSIPCLCSGHDGFSPKINPKRDKRSDINASQLVYYSCEDIYVQVDNGKVYDSLPDFKDVDSLHVTDHHTGAANFINKEDTVEGGNFTFKRFSNAVPEAETDKKPSFSRKTSVFKKKYEQLKVLFSDWG